MQEQEQLEAQKPPPCSEISITIVGFKGQRVHDSQSWASNIWKAPKANLNRNLRIKRKDMFP